jgi:hypothetical protein
MADISLSRSGGPARSIVDFGWRLRLFCGLSNALSAVALRGSRSARGMTIAGTGTDVFSVSNRQGGGFHEEVDRENSER